MLLFHHSSVALRSDERDLIAKVCGDSTVHDVSFHSQVVKRRTTTLEWPGKGEEQWLY
jgi:hypothetical protein